jgi:uncharacterized membrane protein
MIYLMLKTLHILSSVLMVGTGFGSAFYLFFIHRHGNLSSIAQVSRLVVKADWWFTTPAVIIQPLSGAIMLHMAGYPLNGVWIWLSAALYLMAGACWLPVVWLQIRMRDMAAHALAENCELPPLYWRYAHYWEWLGYPAFSAMLIVYGLMVFKPVSLSG